MERLFAIFTVFVMLGSVHDVFAAYDVTRTLGYDSGANAHPHNLSSSSNANVHAASGGEDEICVFCHTPHGGDASQSALWNRADPGGTFPLYNSGTLIIDDADVVGNSKYTNSDAGIAYPNGTTRMCMSCHDGVTAIGTVLNGPNPGNVTIDSSMTMTAYGTIDLEVSHPVSFVYDETVRDAINSKKGGTSYQLPANTKVVLDAQKRMQCTTCHEPHYDTADGTYTLPLWRNFSGTENTDYEGTCNECHGAGAFSWGGAQTSH